MGYTRAWLFSGAAVWLALGLFLASGGHPGFAAAGNDVPVVARVQGQDALATEEQGRDALATAESQEPASGDGSLEPVVTANRRGRLLVLTYAPRATGGSTANRSSRGDRPAFAIHQGRRQVASGQFEYG